MHFSSEIGPCTRFWVTLYIDVFSGVNIPRQSLWSQRSFWVTLYIDLFSGVNISWQSLWGQWRFWVTMYIDVFSGVNIPRQSLLDQWRFWVTLYIDWCVFRCWYSSTVTVKCHPVYWCVFRCWYSSTVTVKSKKVLSHPVHWCVFRCWYSSTVTVRSMKVGWNLCCRTSRLTAETLRSPSSTSSTPTHLRWRRRRWFVAASTGVSSIAGILCRSLCYMMMTASFHQSSNAILWLLLVHFIGSQVSSGHSNPLV